MRRRPEFGLELAAQLGQRQGILSVSFGTLQEGLGKAGRLAGIDDADGKAVVVQMLGDAHPVVAGGFQDSVSAGRLRVGLEQPLLQSIRPVGVCLMVKPRPGWPSGIDPVDAGALGSNIDAHEQRKSCRRRAGIHRHLIFLVV